MRRILRLVSLILFLSAISGATPGRAAETVVSDEGQRQAVDLTIYNHNLALVRDVRQVELPAGVFDFEFRDVPARINPVTLLVSAPDAAGFEILEQNYEFDLLSKEKILAKYVGRELAWVQEDGSRISGELLGVANGPVFKVGGEVVFEVPGRLALPSLPANLRARPTLVWLADSERPGTASIEASYLTKGISWTADYVLQLDAAGEHAGLQSWVSVDNRCGASFAGANLLLVAGDINQVQPDRGVMLEMAAAPMAAKAGGFVEESLYDYHLYTLQRPTTLKDNQIKQISLFEAERIPVTKHYRLAGSPRYFRGNGMMRDEAAVAVSYGFTNNEESGLGMPLPAGVFRVYGMSASGSRQLLGEDRIDHTPRDEEIELTVGTAFDIVAERVRTNSQRVADKVYRHTFRIVLRNHKDEDVVVEVRESVGGYWDVIQSSLDYQKIDATHIGFDVPVSAGDESALTYTVEVKY